MAGHEDVNHVERLSQGPAFHVGSAKVAGEATAGEIAPAF
jgi:hypothetical protein